MEEIIKEYKDKIERIRIAANRCFDKGEDEIGIRKDFIATELEKLIMRIEGAMGKDSNDRSGLHLHNVSGCYSIEFGRDCKAKIKVTNGEPKVEAAMNGWGESIKLSDVKIEKL